MIMSYLAIITVAAALGQEAPAIVKPYRTHAECEVARSELLRTRLKDFKEQGSVPVCLKVDRGGV